MGGNHVKLGLLTASPPYLTLEEFADWAVGQGYEARRRIAAMHRGIAKNCCESINFREREREWI